VTLWIGNLSMGVSRNLRCGGNCKLLGSLQKDELVGTALFLRTNRITISFHDSKRPLPNPRHLRGKRKACSAFPSPLPAGTNDGAFDVVVAVDYYYDPYVGGICGRTRVIRYGSAVRVAECASRCSFRHQLSPQPV